MMDLIIKKGESKELFIDDCKSYNFLLSKESSLILKYYLNSSNNEINLNGKIEENANLDIKVIDLSNGKVNFKVNFDLLKNSKVNFELGSISSKNDVKIFNISFNHLEENSHCKVKNYGVSLDSSRLTFLGTNKICKGAKKSNTSQDNKIIVFDKNAKAIADPILKIDENDVLAFHSAGIGKINEDHLFYLRSKGLNENEAKSLIVRGYINPIASFFNKEIQYQVEKLIEGKCYA